jgi:hypothetical protein
MGFSPLKAQKNTLDNKVSNLTSMFRFALIYMDFSATYGANVALVLHADKMDVKVSNFDTQTQATGANDMKRQNKTPKKTPIKRQLAAQYKWVLLDTSTEALPLPGAKSLIMMAAKTSTKIMTPERPAGPVNDSSINRASFNDQSVRTPRAADNMKRAMKPKRPNVLT